MWNSPGAPTPADTESMAEEVMKKMMEEFSTMGHKDDFNSTIEGMMKQLLAKDVMYIPMKQICEKVWAHTPCRMWPLLAV